MKRFIPLAVIVILVACNSGGDQRADVDTATINPADTLTALMPIDSSTEFLDTFSSNLKPWLEQTVKSTQVKLKDFSYADNWVEDTLVVSRQNLNREFLKSYESVLVYSPDNKKVLDLGSYGGVVTKNKKGETRVQQGEPDIEVAIIDLATNKRRRIFFSGPGNLVEKGFWMNDSTVVLAGKSHEQNAEIPMLWMIKIDDTSNHITRYEYTVR